MNTCTYMHLIVAVVSLVTQVQSASLEVDKVQPFPQPEPVTNSEKAAVKFKPQLKLSGSCHPYPAVDANGDISAGMEPFWTVLNDCGGSELGSQVYARSAWYKDVWAITYAWFFPKEFSYRMGHSSTWEFAIIWIDDPDQENPTIKGVTLQSDEDTTEKHAPVDSKYLDGNSFRIKYDYKFIMGETSLTATTKKGGFQDLITWEQLPDVARTALNSSFGYMPLADEVFNTILADGWPF